MRISDWSSDVCSSDLPMGRPEQGPRRPPAGDRIKPKRTDISTILIIGAGPIVIGQACEFDYSGTQACQALRAEGYRIVLVTSNRSEERRVGKVCVSTFNSRWSPYH